MRPAQVTRGGWHLARAGLSATLASVLAVGGHVLGGGAVCLGVASVPVLVGPAVLCSLVASRRWTCPRLLVALSVTQVFVHLWLSSPAGGAAAGADAASMHTMPSMHTMHSGHSAMTTGGIDARMLAWHVIGCLLSALLLTHAERALCWLLNGLVFARRRDAALLAPAAPASRSIARSRPAGVSSTRLLTGGIGRRGPPARLTFAMT